MPEPPGRPWWRRKWVWAALALWLAVAYPLSLGPVAYLVGRGWITKTQATAVYAPIIYGADSLRPHPGLGLGSPDEEGRRPYIVLPDPDPWPRPVASTAESYLRVVEWFAGLGERHATAN
jgi:hypothetical protein